MSPGSLSPKKIHFMETGQSDILRIRFPLEAVSQFVIAAKSRIAGLVRWKIPTPLVGNDRFDALRNSLPTCFPAKERQNNRAQRHNDPHCNKGGPPRVNTLATAGHI